MSHKVYTIEGQSLELNSNNGWLYLYKEYFGHDILPDLLPMLESILNVIGNTIDALEGEKATEENVIRALASPEVISGLFADIGMLEITTVNNIFWCMVKNANMSTPEPRTFFNQFEKFPYDEIAPMLFNQIIDSCMSSKNLESLKAKHPSLSMILQSQE